VIHGRLPFSFRHCRFLGRALNSQVNNLFRRITLWEQLTLPDGLTDHAVERFDSAVGINGFADIVWIIEQRIEVILGRAR
jgi:hypothetical protein